MPWQDELRKLDEELATGRISADEYRSRRDQIMVTAVAPASEPPAPSVGESTTVMSPVPQEPRPAPQEPQQAPQEPRPAADADKTQVVSGQAGDAERTQLVGGWRSTPPDDPNRTQVVPGVPPQSYAGARPPRPAPGGYEQNQPPWQNEEQMPAPWTGQSFPPLGAALNNAPEWTLQGPEVFESEKKSGAGKVLATIGIVVVLLGIAAGAYFLFRPDGNQQAGPPNDTDRTSTNQPTTTTSQVAEGPIVELPGKPMKMESITTFPQVEGMNYLTPQEIDIYRAGVAGESAVAISTEDDVQIIVVIVTMQSPEAAATARDALANLQLNFTLVTEESEEGVLAAGNPNAADGPIHRAHYASGDQVVRIQTQGQDADAATRLFNDVIAAQLEELPADV